MTNDGKKGGGKLEKNWGGILGKFQVMGLYRG